MPRARLENLGDRLASHPALAQLGREQARAPRTKRLPLLDPVTRKSTIVEQPHALQSLDHPIDELVGEPLPLQTRANLTLAAWAGR